jgi:hypothetical protein
MYVDLMETGRAVSMQILAEQVTRASERDTVAQRSSVTAHADIKEMCCC